ncbi:unnamed protein product [Sphenostylis stenocarpa]|uniref:Uncharacterized protein n=1 Tax=Sphenostylis stenocarpa TaxID=92480 RepID=A0AA86VUX0_9FABA|nr:unnamed protein product [Sphenostylis stenocarpa]
MVGKLILKQCKPTQRNANPIVHVGDEFLVVNINKLEEDIKGDSDGKMDEEAYGSAHGFIQEKIVKELESGGTKALRHSEWSWPWSLMTKQVKANWTRKMRCLGRSKRYHENQGCGVVVGFGGHDLIKNKRL